MINENKMGTRPVFPLLISMALPAIIAMTVQSLYNIVDSYFVSLVSEEALRAVSIIFPIQNLIIAFSVGTSVGVNSLVSRSLGAGELQRAKLAAAHGFVLNTLTWLIFLFVGIFASRPFVNLFDSDPAVLSMGTTYMTIVCVFSLGIFLEITLEKILQSTGNMVLPMALQMTGAITNCILDPLFIFGIGPFPRLGIEGAAIATVFSQTLPFIIGLIYLRIKPFVIHISFKGFSFNKEILKQIYEVSSASIFTMAVMSVVVMSLNSILATFSAVAISVLGIYFKLQSFVYMPIFGLSQGLLPIVGYNYGAKQLHRVDLTVRYASILSVVFMLICSIVFISYPETLLGIFSANDEMLAIGRPALEIIAIGYLPSAISIIYFSFFQGVGSGRKALAVSLLRQLIFLLPLAWVGAKFFGIEAVWFAFPIAELACLIISIYYRVQLHHRHKLELLKN